MSGWLIELNRMRAIDQLSEEQIRQLSFDLENAMHEFKQHMQ
ncbi:MAG: hypothetical protein V2I33_23430 [Kangiellaceae bacterium]|nr:hypothetical protein [Kangiellaceae bacterium]